MTSGRGKFFGKQPKKGEGEMKYGDLTLGQIEAIVNKLGGLEGVYRFLAGELVVEEIKSQFRIWKTVQRSAEFFKTPDDFRRILSASGYKISDYANDIMSRPAFIQSLADTDDEQECDLVLLTTAQLTDNKQGGTTAEIFAGAERLGLVKCPAWVGPSLRQKYQDQPNGQWVFIGMEPILGSGGGLRVFSVERNVSGLWLHGLWVHPDFVWGPDDLWAFCRPRK